MEAGIPQGMCRLALWSSSRREGENRHLLNMDYNVDHIRDLLKDYYGTAMFNGFPMAIVDLGKVDRMSDEEVIKEAIKIGIL